MTTNEIDKIINEIYQNDIENLNKIIHKINYRNENEFQVELLEPFENNLNAEKILSKYFDRSVQIKDKTIFIGPYLISDKINLAISHAFEEERENKELKQLVTELIKSLEKQKVNETKEEFKLYYFISKDYHRLISIILKNYFNRTVKISQPCRDFEGFCTPSFCDCSAAINFGSKN